MAKVNYEAAKKDLDRANDLFKQQSIPQSQYDDAVTREQFSLAQYQAAQSNLELAKSSPNMDDIDLSSQQLLAQIKQAEANLTLLQTQLDDTKIYAPADGVLAAKLMQPGELTAPGTALFTILDDSKPWVKIYLSLKETERVSLNQSAYIQMDAFPDRKFYGRVSFISSEAEFTPKDYQSKEERIKQVYAVKVELKNPDKLLKAGMPVDVTVEVGKAKQKKGRD